MNDQLVLIRIAETTGAGAGIREEWPLDRATRAVGRRGVILARQALRAARARGEGAAFADGSLPAAA